MDKFEENFGEQGAYLIDFYHVSQYLAAAAASISRNGKEKQWLRRQQGRLLNNQVAKVLRALIPHQEDACVEEAPVRVAYGYLQERRNHLDYAGTRRRGLPIGSGESKADTAISSSNDSSFRVAGGRNLMLIPCSTCPSPAPTTYGHPTGLPPSIDHQLKSHPAAPSQLCRERNLAIL